MSSQILDHDLKLMHLLRAVHLCTQTSPQKDVFEQF